jgi:hypothetical protein
VVVDAPSTCPTIGEDVASTVGVVVPIGIVDVATDEVLVAVEVALFVLKTVELAVEVAVEPILIPLPPTLGAGFEKCFKIPTQSFPDAATIA